MATSCPDDSLTECTHRFLHAEAVACRVEFGGDERSAGGAAHRTGRDARACPRRRPPHPPRRRDRLQGPRGTTVSRAVIDEHSRSQCRSPRTIAQAGGVRRTALTWQSGGSTLRSMKWPSISAMTRGQFSDSVVSSDAGTPRDPGTDTSVSLASINKLGRATDDLADATINGFVPRAPLRQRSRASVRRRAQPTARCCEESALPDRASLKGRSLSSEHVGIRQTFSVCQGG